MKVVILAGGFGTRISEESHLKPKPMLEIGEMPILWHIMKGYSYYGFNEFVICAGYKQHFIKEWFANYFLQTSDVTFDFTNGNDMIVHHKKVEPWKVTVVDTGLRTMTGGRVKRIKEYVENETFMLTYGDAVSDININDILRFHNSHNHIATMSVYNYGQTKGIVEMSKDGTVKAFREKADNDGDRINIGYMVLEPAIFNYIEDDETVFEKDPLNNLVLNDELDAFEHKGFWQCMDTLREKNKLEAMWEGGNAPWKLWKD